MKSFIKNFCLRGFIAAGFGPLILVTIYYGYQVTENINSRPISEININILSTLAMAFIAGGIGAVFKIEKLSLGMATLIDAVVIYLDYLFFYLTNNWLQSGIIPLLVFTLIYAVGYVIIWVIIYHQVKKQVCEINHKI